MVKMNYSIPWWKVEFGEEEFSSLRDAYFNKNISQAIVTERLELEFSQALGIPYAIAVPNGSSALLLSMMALGISKGDEVIIPDRTWIAGANAILLLGAVPVIVDVDPLNDSLIDLKAVERAITPKVKAIMPVHLNGHCVDMDGMITIAKNNNLYIIEDACQALFSGYAGTKGDVGCFSFSMGKLLSAGQGGMVVTKNKELYDKMKILKLQGAGNNLEPSYKMLGFNFKVTDLMASLLIPQLRKRKELINSLWKIYSLYSRGLNGCNILELTRWRENEVPLYVEIKTSKREEMIDFLIKKRIQTRRALPPLHTASYFPSEGNYKYSTDSSEKGLFLPSGMGQSEEDIQRVIGIIRIFENEIMENEEHKDRTSCC